MDFEKIIKETINDKINVNAIYIFGSIFTKHFNKESDIDIAILKDSIVDKMLIFETKKDLEYKLKRDVDLVDMQYCRKYSLILGMQILINGKLIYCNNNNKRLDFEDLLFVDYVRLKDLNFDLVSNC